MLFRSIVAEDGRKPPLGGRHVHALAGGVILQLFAADLAGSEILRLRVVDVIAGNRGGRKYYEALRQLYTDVVRRVEQFEQVGLLRMVGAGRMPR